MDKMLGIALLLGTMGLSAAAPTDGAVAFRAQARVELDAQGVPRRVHADQALPAPVRDAIEKRVLQWRFEPAHVNGEPRSGATTVFLNTCAMPAENAALRLAMEYHGHGPGYTGGGSAPMPPRYPVDAVRVGKQGAFRVTLEIGVDGHARIQDIETLKGTAWPFQKRLKEWASSLRYVPEEVDGRPVATRIALSVAFTIGDGAPRQRAAPEHAAACSAAMGAGDGEEPLQPVVLDSPFKLKEAG